MPRTMTATVMTLMLGLSTLGLAACGGSGGGAKTADDAAAEGGAAKGGGMAFKAGTKVCISGVAGVRFGLEDALTERGLEIANTCMSADFEMEESGEAGAWVLKSREIGGEWSTCESAAQDRDAFIDECLGGGSGADDLGADEGGDDSGGDDSGDDE